MLFLRCRALLCITATAIIAGVFAQETSQGSGATNQTFTEVNGQILTPGLAIVDAPQPYTPEGGDVLQLALDVSGNGKLSLPPYPSSAPTKFYNITAFLYSYETQHNYTISNGTADGWTNGCYYLTNTNENPIAAGCTPIILQEQFSTVKHVNFVWPDCFVGDGAESSSSSSRGNYNISIHQHFRLNNTDYYTIFDLPISTTNSIPNTTAALGGGSRFSCEPLDNPILSPESQRASDDTLGWQPWLAGNNAVSTVAASNTATATGSVETAGNGNGAIGGSGSGQGSIGAGAVLRISLESVLLGGLLTILFGIFAL